MLKEKRILLKGISKEATRIEILGARKLFDNMVKNEFEDRNNVYKINKILRYPFNESYIFAPVGTDDLDVELAVEDLYKYVVGWIDEMLSPTYNHSAIDNRKPQDYGERYKNVKPFKSDRVVNIQPLLSCEKIKKLTKEGAIDIFIKMVKDSHHLIEKLRNLMISNGAIGYDIFIDKK